MIDDLYFLSIRQFNKSKSTKIRLLWSNFGGILSFFKSAVKHISRKSPRWLVKQQISGIFMCMKQILIISLK
jgi:hypothetical protein